MMLRPDDIEDLCPLSPLQQGMLHHTLREPAAGLYVEHTSLLLEGVLDVDLFEQAWRHVCARHTALRTSFLWDGVPEPLQVVQREPRLHLAFTDLSAEPNAQERVHALEEEARAQGVGLDEAPPMRLRLVRLAPRRHRLLWTFHHAILDGWSVPLVLGEVIHVHAALLGGAAPDLPPARPYADHIRHLQGLDAAAAEAHWRAALAGLEGPTPLPGEGGGRLASQSASFAEATLSLDAESTARLHAFARELRVTPNSLLQGAWAILLARHAMRDDIVFGATVSGRPAELDGVESMVGLFINTVPVRARVEDDASVGSWLADLHARQTEARRFEHCALVDVRAWSGLPHSAPLFETLVVYENYPLREGGAAQPLEVRELRATERTNFPLTLVAGPAERLHLKVIHDEHRIDATQARRVLERLAVILAELPRDPQRRIADLPMMPESELRRIEALEQPARSAGETPDVVALVKEQARTRPEHMAVVDAQDCLTYAQLDESSSRVATALRAMGIGAGDLVALGLARSTDLFVAMLGALKAGAAYMPFDPALPAQRLAALAADARPAALLTRKQDAPRMPAHPRVVDLAHASSSTPEAEAQDTATAPDQLAYVIHTSGSTGKPKGVMVSRGALANLVAWHRETYAPTHEDRSSHLAGLSFDASVWEAWPPLCSGATLHLVDDETRVDPERLRDWMLRNSVTLAFAPTPLATELIAAEWPARTPLRALLTGGDALARGPPSTLPFELVNHYGPTECTVVATRARVPTRDQDARVPPIGRPIRGVHARLLDARGRRTPFGSPGELCLGGASLALGYLHEPALTAARFIQDPFAPGARLYRTGDLARYREDGELEFIGRLDEQVKVRGVRIEPAEVEAALLALEGVAAACVVAIPMSRGDANLVAYVVPANGAGVDVTRLRDALARSLPEAMVPARFVRVEAIPLTSNGKVDRAALPRPDEAAGSYAAPTSAPEELLCTLWEDVLRVDRVGIHDDFFSLGGHSLLATRLVSRIRETFEIDLPLAALFEAPTIAGLAGRIASGQSSAAAGGHQETAPLPARLRTRQAPGPAPLSYAQQRLWFLEQWRTGTATYHVPAALRLRGQLHPTALADALSGIVQRHEVLRTVVRLDRDGPVQAPMPPTPLAIPLLDLTSFPPARREAAYRETQDQEMGRPFALERDAPMRARLVRFAPDEHVLLLVFHHIAFDGWSLGILLRELEELYAARLAGRTPRLPELGLQYADHAAWQRERLAGDHMQAELAHWRHRLRGLAPLEIPTDHPRPAFQSVRGAHAPIEIRSDLVSRLRALGRQEGVTLFMEILAAFQVLLHRHSRQHDFGVGVPVAGRTGEGTDALIGLFVNTLVLHADVDGDPTFSELLARVRRTCLDAYAHQDMPFERLVAEIQPDRDPSRPPLVQVMLALHEDLAPQARLEGLDVTPEGVESGTAKFDLTLSLIESAQGLRGSLEYNTDLFDRASAQRFVEQLCTLLDAATRAPDTPISRLPLVTPRQRQDILALGRATPPRLPAPRCIHDAFAQQACRHAERVALTCGDERLTYAELDARANRLAHRLRRMGAGPEVMVALCAERGIDMLVGILGILKAGAAYVPLDPASPPERVAFIFEDTQAPVLLTQSDLVQRLPRHPRTLLLDDATLAEEPHVAPASGATPSSLAYVIYTSGSTGKPKGVMVEHAQVTRLFDATRAWFDFGAGDVWTLFHSFAFDFSVWEIWGALLHGGRLVVVPHEIARSPDAFHELLAREGVTILNQTPSAFRQLIRADEDSPRSGQLALREIIFGGEALEPLTLRPWIARHGAQRPRLVNMYGITETTVHVTFRPITENDLTRSHVSPIGAPIPDLDLHVLDEHLEPAPIGVPGELHVGGAGVARGYLRRPELDASRFVRDPHGGDGRLYRSGDLARRLPDGDIAYLGRIDEQVKIRGFRIELGEIEAVLVRHEQVREACVLAREDPPGDKRLVAYVVARDAAARPTTTQLRAFLKKILPPHMIPAAFVTIDGLPLTTNGKVDRRALPAPERERPDLESAYVPPRDETETILAGVWRDVLGLERVGVEDNFFELGGDSLRSITAVVRASEAGVALQPRDLFEWQTISQLARHARSARSTNASTLVPMRKAGARTPFFCVHPGGGTVGTYAQLARALGESQPFYAIQAAGIDDERDPDTTVAAMARRYVRDMREVQPTGPYRIGGWSLGGVISYEMARQLEAAGETVDALVLIDPGIAGHGRQRDEIGELVREVEAIAVKADALPPADPRVKAYHAEVGSRLRDLGIPGNFEAIGLATLRRMLKVFEAQTDAGRGFTFEEYGGDVTLILARETLRQTPHYGDLWRGIVKGRLDLVVVDGHHWSIMLSPDDSRALVRAIDKTLATPATREVSP